MTVVLDASAVLALVLKERGGSVVVGYLGDCQMSAVNHAEVLSRLAYLGVPVETSAAVVDRLRIAICSFTADHAHRVALMRVATAPAGLSLGDRACIALAGETGYPVVTADRVWAELALDVEVIAVR